MTTKHEYETVAGTDPDVDEQHQPRTLKHFENDGDRKDFVHVMSEIGDGTFVAWTECRACHKHVRDCTCPGGPVEADYIGKWRDQRFTLSFARRAALPTLPETIRTRDRMINAVLRHLRQLGWTIEPPADKKSDPDPDFEFDPSVDVEDDDDYVAPISGMEGEANDYAESLHATELSDDERDHEETGPDGDARTYDPETGEKIESAEPINDRLARLQEGTYDAGF